LTVNANVAVTATFTAMPKCVVPHVKGDTLSRAETRIRAAGCAVGKVTNPAHSARQRLVVGSTTPAAGTSHPAGTLVAISMIRRRRHGS
jgi:serine/threonine-protein kinase